MREMPFTVQSKGDGTAMREIKFRAWDVNKKRMIYLKNEKKHPPYLRKQLPTNDFVLVIGEEWETEPVETVMDVILMQFTGLFDKNGKEICEGDIVRSTYSLIGPGVLPERKESIIRLVEWGELSSMDYDGSFLGMGLKISDENSADLEMEVIGNIYSNPELIKGGQQ
jgi:uncharacterized phage protein (TIGR01671 family)